MNQHQDQDHQPVDMEEEDKVKASSVSLQRTLSAVTYCCGACGYDLRLRSSDRDTAAALLARRGVVAFAAIDDARFGHADEFRCLDVRARRLFVRRTRLLCRKCGATLGFGYHDLAAAARPPRYDIRIRALQPLPAAAAAADSSPPPAPSDAVAA